MLLLIKKDVICNIIWLIFYNYNVIMINIIYIYVYKFDDFLFIFFVGLKWILNVN